MVKATSHSTRKMVPTTPKAHTILKRTQRKLQRAERASADDEGRKPARITLSDVIEITCASALSSL